MVTFQEAREQILNVIKRVGDEEYQRRSWFGIGPEVSSPDEMICEVFDDRFVPEWLGEHQVHFTEQQLHVARI